MIEFEHQVQCRMGIHAQNAALIAFTIRQYDEVHVTFSSGGKFADAKNVFELLALGAMHGAKIKVFVQGNDEKGTASKVKVLLIEHA